MRPGPIRPGDDPWQHGVETVLPQASMRPGPIRPGDPSVVDDSVWVNALQ